MVSFVALTILGTLTFLLTGGTLFEPKTTLYLYLPDATGLLGGAPVRVNGISVGKVAAVEVSGSKELFRTVKVTMTIEKDRLPSIAIDSTAQVASETVVGDKYVAITSGKKPDHVPPNSELRYQGAEELLKTEDIKQFEKQLLTFDALFRDIEEGKNTVGEFVKGDQVYRTFLRKVVEIERGVKAMADTRDALGRELYTDHLAKQMHDLIAGYDNQLAQLQAGQGSGGKFLRDPAQYQEMRDQLGKLRSTVADMAKGPMLSSDQSYNDWTRQVASLIQRVDDFNKTPIMLTPAAYESLKGAVDEMRREGKDFRENPRKYLRMKVF